MTAYRASLERGSDGWCTVWIAGLPGLFVSASSEGVALRAVPQTVTAYLQWLERHGALPDPPRRITVSVVERHRVPVPLREGGFHALCGFERPPVTPEELVHLHRLMGIVRADTIRLVEGLRRRDLDWSGSGEPRTLKDTLVHIAAAERSYLQQLRLGPLPPVGRSRGPLDRLARVRAMVAWRLMQLTPEELARVVQTGGEWWSARKMLGRMLAHERYHLRAMARIVRRHGRTVPAGLAGWARY